MPLKLPHHQLQVLRKQLTNPKRDTEKDNSMSKTHWRKKQQDNIESTNYLNMVGSGQTHQMDKYKIETRWVTTNYVWPVWSWSKYLNILFVLFIYEIQQVLRNLVKVIQALLKMGHHAQSVDDALIGGLS